MPTVYFSLYRSDKGSFFLGDCGKTCASGLTSSTFSCGLSEGDVCLKKWESLGLLGHHSDGSSNCLDSSSYDGGPGRGAAGDIGID